jgi:hypothetical protein
MISLKYCPLIRDGITLKSRVSRINVFEPIGTAVPFCTFTVAPVSVTIFSSLPLVKLTLPEVQYKDIVYSVGAEQFNGGTKHILICAINT